MKEEKEATFCFSVSEKRIEYTNIYLTTIEVESKHFADTQFRFELLELLNKYCKTNMESKNTTLYKYEIWLASDSHIKFDCWVPISDEQLEGRDIEYHLNTGLLRKINQ